MVYHVDFKEVGLLDFVKMEFVKMWIIDYNSEIVISKELLCITKIIFLHI